MRQGPFSRNEMRGADAALLDSDMRGGMVRGKGINYICGGERRGVDTRIFPGLELAPVFFPRGLAF